MTQCETCGGWMVDNVGDSDRWQDPRDISGGETDCANTERATYLGALITAYGDACYEFGAKDSLGTDSQEEYLRFERIADEAKRELLAEIARVTGAKSVR